MITNINFTAWPEMLAWPYLILHGWLPYHDIAIAHNPLLLLNLVIFFKLFGVGIMQLKIFTWILIAVNACLTFYVTKKFWTKNTAILSSILYLLFCVIFEGNGLWFDLALTPFALLLYLFLREQKYIWAGVVFALGFLTKQTFIYFLIPSAIMMIISSKLKIKNYLRFIVGSFLILLLPLLLFAYLGILDDYYNWSINFGILYLPNVVGQISLPNLKQFIFALVPFGVSIFNLSLFPWMLAGMAGVYPRWELFHFQPALPFVSLAIASFIYSKRNGFLKSVIIICSILYIGYGISRQLGDATRFYESDVQHLANSIRDLKVKNIYIINYWDNLYALTNTLPNKPLIPYIPWYLNYNNNKELILNNLKLKMPEAIIIGSRDKVFLEIYDFINKYYKCNKVVGTVEFCIKNI